MIIESGFHHLTEKSITATVNENAVVEIINHCQSLTLTIGKNARVHLTTIGQGNIKQTCTLKKNSFVHWTTILNQKSEFTGISLLEGDDSLVKTITLGTETVKVNTQSIHTGKNTSSDMITKGVVEKRMETRGLVKINPEADNAKGYQKIHLLLTNKDAKTIAIPDLEIENNNVTCSHGATISTIDDEQLFYLTSRGISKEDSKNLIIKGFIDEVYDKLPQKTKEVVL